MKYIKNEEQLLSHGHQELRRIAIKIVEHALSKADPYVAVKKLIKLHNNTLYIGEQKIDLDKIGKIYLIGAGKATFPIALALEEILSDRIEDGVIICKYGQDEHLKYSRLYHAGHPIPDEKWTLCN